MLEYDRIDVSEEIDINKTGLIFATIGILKKLILSMRSIFAMAVTI